VFDALAERDHQFQGLITNGDNTFHALAQNSQAFADAFRGLPAFERNSSVALRRLDRFSTAASPLLDQLRPAERELAPLVKTVKSFSPDFNSLLTNLGPLTKAARKGLPDLTTSLNLTKPVLENLSPVLRNLDPLLQYAGEYVPELQAFFANITAASEAHDRNADDPAGPLQHYLRGLNTVTPEDLAVYHQRIGTNRANPYFQPGAFRALGSGLPVFSGASCANSAPTVEGPPNETVPQPILYRLVAEPKDAEGKPAKNAQGEIISSTNPVANEPGQPNKVQAPACNQQGPFEFNGQTGQFPRLYTNAGGK
jgi:phospholipid/cholesterol/gamma-HCH transport system substrate-binding protein